MKLGRPFGEILMPFVAAIMTTASIASCENSLKDIQELNEKKIGIDTAHNIRGYRSSDGRLKARLTAPLMLRFQDTLPRIVFPHSLHVDFYDDSMTIESTLDARYAFYIENQNRVFLRDSVVAINKENGDTLKCPQLWWDQRLEKFYTSSPARVLGRERGIICDSLEASQNFTNVQYYGVRNSWFRVSSSEFPE